MLDTRTLVLDDDASTVEILVRVLHDTVRQVDQAVDCERALELFATHRHSVVVLDYKMPKMDGFEVMQRIHLLDPGHRSSWSPAFRASSARRRR